MTEEKMEEVLKERHKLLERMRDSFQEELIASEIAVPDQEGASEILNVVLDMLGGGEAEEGSFGEFYFDPIHSEEDEIQRFTAAITIMDQLSEEHLPELYEAMAHINFRLPCGAYSIDKEKQFLAYRLTVPLSMELKGDTLYDAMDVCVASAINAADLYMEPLIRLAIGELTLEEMEALLP